MDGSDVLRDFTQYAPGYLTVTEVTELPFSSVSSPNWDYFNHPIIWRYLNFEVKLFFASLEDVWGMAVELQSFESQH